MRNLRREEGWRAQRLAGAAVAVVALAAAGVLVGAGFASGTVRLISDATGATGATGGTGATGPTGIPTSGKITICHRTGSRKHPAHTITISVRTWPAHQR